MGRIPTWVVGHGGLLGSHVVRALVSQMPEAIYWENPIRPFCWTDQDKLFEQMAGAATLFAEAVRAAGGSWMVIWTAGAGVVATPRPALDAECTTWRQLLKLLDAHFLDSPAPVPGTIFLASSAGGVFGQGSDRTLTEETPCCPVSDYGRCKLRQEKELRDWAQQRPGVRYLIGRIANLYGPGQNLTKPQGLISQLCRCMLFQFPAHIYVPLDTIRDYLFVEDCAEQIVRCLRRVAEEENCRVLKLLASEKQTSVAQLIGLFTRLFPKHPRIICGHSAQRQRQPAKLRFQSVVWPDLSLRRPTPLAVGVARVCRHQLALLGKGQLPPPR